MHRVAFLTCMIFSDGLTARSQALIETKPGISESRLDRFGHLQP